MSVTIKTICNGDTHRRTIDSKKISFNDFRSIVSEMYASHGLKKFALTYIDEDGDRITIGSDAEFKEAIALTNGGILRLNVESLNANIEQAKEEEEKEEKEDDNVERQFNQLQEALAAEADREADAAIDEFEPLDSLNEEAELAAAIKASLEEQANKIDDNDVEPVEEEKDEPEHEEHPLSALRALLQMNGADDDANGVNNSKFADFIAKIEECLGETADSLAVHLDNAVNKFDETADKIGEKAVNTHETMKKAGAERCRALQQAVASLMQSEIVSRQSLADVYQALLASPAQVQALVLSLVDKAKQQQEVSCIVLMTIE